MYDARQIANWFLERAKLDNRKLSIMSLLKLVYIAHGWHLEMRKSPLITNKIEAWKYGPVVPDVYNAFRKQGVEPTETVEVVGPQLHSHDEYLLQEIYRIYGSMSAIQLSNLTHEPGGPWEISSQRWGYFAPIPNDLIQSHYEAKRSNYVG
ncbi:type II toxin-antitoxin system antitoxin SocA domain-containing protein [Rhizobium sp.]|jgi:uncharacterized phage-associated protein|uniref:Panacea domain-containing protein n=1 Tax=Rhizobium sp. TaxID=391 RepID=UPI000E81430E|nr:hypothetical protein [Rhizobium sp.]